MRACDTIARLTLFLAGLLGATGIGLAAAANHLDDPSGFSAAATVCLANAPALIGLYAVRPSLRLAPLAALVIACGALLFTADMLLRHFYGMRVFAMAAPTGGMLQIIGWLIVAVSALLPKPTA
ncbi:MAG: DUF423 domain-containing protein [Shinella sp.]|nr:MAG: DUF423 domain-containing protein [Shinella sp.]